MGERFDESRISDQKRVARAEHWLLARTLLRRRDKSHHPRWRVLTLAGASPRGEIDAIRSLMFNAYIVAADLDDTCLAAAIECGVNESVHGDVLETVDVPRETGRTTVAIPSLIQQQGRFDVVNLDLCGPVSDKLAKAVRVYLKMALTPRGVLMVTFSYGRDVVEVFTGRDWERYFTVGLGGHPPNIVKRQLPSEIGESLAGRIVHLGHLKNIESIISYQGNEMPMCSVFYSSDNSKDALRGRSPRFIRLADEDLGLAVVYQDVAHLYDCPAERIQAFRNHFAALKAVATRKAKQSLNQPPVTEDPKA